jgi:hypothetical protein
MATGCDVDQLCFYDGFLKYAQHAELYLQGFYKSAVDSNEFDLHHSGIEANKIVIAGDSAGANLALAILLTLRDANKTRPAARAATLRATHEYE